MADLYEGLSDEQAIAAICEEWGCKPDSQEAQIHLLIARGIMNTKGEIKHDDGTIGQY